MLTQFQIAAGSVTGREHLRLGKNNQDALYYRCLPWATIAVVCDGCGSSAHSEVGAKLGAKIVVESLHYVGGGVESQRQLWEARDCRGSALCLPNAGSGEFWQQVQQEVVQRLSKLAFLLGGEVPQTVHDYLLFTIAGVLITPVTTVAFALGDGVIIVNGEILPMPPFANNAPPYIAYGLLEPIPVNPTLLQFQRYAELPTDQVQAIVIGSDGVQDLIAAADKPFPGKTELVGDISQFWQGDCYFQNPDYLRRRLALINREVTKADWENQQLIKQGGLLPDDATLVVVRKVRS
jgi:hypothetical protein